MQVALKQNEQPEKQKCMRCGRCCLTNMAAISYEIKETDYIRWQKEKRYDIIELLEKEAPIWAGDHLVSAKTGKPVYGCPFITWDGNFYACSIYETRPEVCREFEAGSSELCPLHE